MRPGQLHRLWLLCWLSHTGNARSLPHKGTRDSLLYCDADSAPVSYTHLHPKDPLIHQGVYIDIFPCDNLSDRPLMRKLQFAASKIVIAKALYARGYETNSFVKKLFMQLCRVLPREKLERFCANRDDVHTSMCHTFFAAGKKYGKNIFPRAWFEETVELPFEDGAFPVSAHYDALLSRLYGDCLLYTSNPVTRTISPP